VPCLLTFRHGCSGCNPSLPACFSQPVAVDIGGGVQGPTWRHPPLLELPVASIDGFVLYTLVKVCVLPCSRPMCRRACRLPAGWPGECRRASWLLPKHPLGLGRPHGFLGSAPWSRCTAYRTGAPARQGTVL
jgi:hypothetical protein